jgi:hypothetical protein
VFNKSVKLRFSSISLLDSNGKADHTEYGIKAAVRLAEVIPAA